jgi:hypothetical protein
MPMLENRAQNAPAGRLQGSREEGGPLGCKVDQLLAWQGPYIRLTLKRMSFRASQSTHLGDYSRLEG